jgi:hypothetical protein
MEVSWRKGIDELKKDISGSETDGSPVYTGL